MAKFEYPKLLYKFRSWKDDYHKRVLTDNELYLAAPNMFNDPFDTKIYPNFSLLKSVEEQRKYSDLFFIKNFNDYSEKTNDPEIILRELERIDREIHSGDFEKFNNNYWDQIYDSQLGIIPFAEIKDDKMPENNILLWTHYSSNHKGFCVVFNGEKLIEEFRNVYGGSGGSISYNDYPNIDPFDTFEDDKFQLSQITKRFTKSKFWEYESEYRLTAIAPLGYGLERKFYFTSSCVNKVIVGCEMPQSDVDELVLKCREKGWRVCRANRRPHSFELDFEQIA